MNNPQSVAIVERFFTAIDALIQMRTIRGLQTFTRKYDINRRNLQTLRKEPQRDIFQPCWLTYLVVDYGVSAHWLLTGKGTIFGNRKTKSLQMFCNNIFETQRK